MDDIKNDPDWLITRLENLAWRAPEGEPYADALRQAANEIKRLRAEAIAVRAERDSAQIQANHLAQRLVQEVHRG